MAHQCNICHSRILRHSKNLKCFSCGDLTHIKCLDNVNSNDSIYVERSSNHWLCTICSQSIFPFNHYDEDNDFETAIFSSTTNIKRFNQSIFSDLQFNLMDTNDDNSLAPIPLMDSDPDLQYYNDATSINNVTHCNYYLENTFNNKCNQLKIDNNSYSLCHVNLRSIPKNLCKFEKYLENLKCSFSVIGISETWLTDHNVDCYGINGYNHFNLHRQGKRGGGVSLFVNELLAANERADLNMMSEHLEAVFIEITKNNLGIEKDIVIGVVYRPPNQDVSIFNESINDILQRLKVENKSIYYG